MRRWYKCDGNCDLDIKRKYRIQASVTSDGSFVPEGVAKSLVFNKASFVGNVEPDPPYGVTYPVRTVCAHEFTQRLRVAVPWHRREAEMGAARTLVASYPKSVRCIRYAVAPRSFHLERICPSR